MAEDDYDLLPHQEIKRLRDQIKNLKSQLGQKDVKPSSLQGSVDTLNESMKLLITIFQEASKNIEGEPHKATHEHLDGMNTHLDNLNSKMEQLLKHNEEIAKGILVVANLIKESNVGPSMPTSMPPPSQRPVPRVPRAPQQSQRVPLPSFEDESI